MSSYSDSKLAQYCYGTYSDNALTFLMRIDLKSSFEYVLSRGIPISLSDRNNNNLLHYAVSLERCDYVSFLLEGNYQNYMQTLTFIDSMTLTDFENDFEAYPWIENAW